VLVLTRDPVADRIAAVVVCALTRTRRQLVSELELTPALDGVPTTCVANFDTLHTIPRRALRRRVTTLTPGRMAEACRVLRDATGC
jgi:mRNA interferase MazF